jgi:hypothetical protein
MSSESEKTQLLSAVASEDVPSINAEGDSSSKLWGDRQEHDHTSSTKYGHLPLSYLSVCLPMCPPPSLSVYARLAP